MAAVLGLAHVRARRETPEAVAAAFFPLNALVSILWLAGVMVDVVVRQARA
jgi:hypothetical protein